MQLLGRQWLILTSEGHQHAVVPRGSTGEHPVNEHFLSLFLSMYCSKVHASCRKTLDLGGKPAVSPFDLGR